MTSWYRACSKVADELAAEVPESYRSRTLAGILGDIKALPPRKALSLISRKKGLGRQYASLYLSSGIDGGRGYQACAMEALGASLGMARDDILRGRILDAGCAVGVSAGVLGLDGVTGFDLFPDLLRAARHVDGLTGGANNYAVADMTRDWPFRDGMFDTVTACLVCHHLKCQDAIDVFFRSANNVLGQGGSLVLTLPARSVATAHILHSITGGLGAYGFTVVRELSGLVHSIDDPRSLFWMFQLVAIKTASPSGAPFVSPGFGFHHARTPETREKKSEQARATATSTRSVRHEHFRLVTIDELVRLFGGDNLVYETLAPALA